MTVKEYASCLGMRVITGEAGLNREVTGAYVCDLLSWAMSHASKGDAWITVLTNLNTVAVALLTEVSCIIIPEDIALEEATINRAVQENISILTTSMSAYETCWRTKAIIH